MAFKDFTEFTAGPLELPYRGKVYTLPEVSIDLGARLVTELEDPTSPFAALPVEDAWALLLGDALTEMRADGCPARFVNRVFLTALADFKYGRESAEATWEAGTDPKVLAEFYTAKAAELTATPEELEAA